jgi:hypothetical protein
MDKSRPADAELGKLVLHPSFTCLRAGDHRTVDTLALNNPLALATRKLPVLPDCSVRIAGSAAKNLSRPVYVQIIMLLDETHREESGEIPVGPSIPFRVSWNLDKISAIEPFVPEANHLRLGLAHQSGWLSCTIEKGGPACRLSSSLDLFPSEWWSQVQNCSINAPDFGGLLLSASGAACVSTDFGFLYG